MTTGLLTAACGTAEPSPSPPPVRTTPAASRPGAGTAATDGVIVAELFTSQGCSSCPPADHLLSRLAAGELGDRPVIALAYHVDYWDDLGWADPFSSAAATRRQSAYAEAVSGGRVYTPQLVIDGRLDVVGSREGAVRRALAGAPALAGFEARAERRGDRLEIEARPPSGTRTVVAVYQDGLVTRVSAGENHGDTLRNDRVVRALVPLVEGRAEVVLDPRWETSRLGAVLLAQGDDQALVAAQPLTF